MTSYLCLKFQQNLCSSSNVILLTNRDTTMILLGPWLTQWWSCFFFVFFLTGIMWMSRSPPWLLCLLWPPCLVAWRSHDAGFGWKQVASRLQCWHFLEYGCAFYCLWTLAMKKTVADVQWSHETEWGLLSTTIILHTVSLDILLNSLWWIL